MPTHYKGSEKERRALDVYIKLFRATESVSGRTAGPIIAAGLSPSQFGVLETLYHLGPLMVSQLADKHLKSRNNFTVVVDNLEKQGLVRRERSHEDRRAVWVHLTETGQERIERIIPEHACAVARDMEVLTDEEQEQLGTLLRRLGRQEKAE